MQGRIGRGPSQASIGISLAAGTQTRAGWLALFLGLTQTWTYINDEGTAPRRADRPSKEADRLKSDCRERHARVEGEANPTFLWCEQALTHHDRNSQDGPVGKARLQIGQSQFYPLVLDEIMCVEHLTQDLALWRYLVMLVYENG